MGGSMALAYLIQVEPNFVSCVAAHDMGFMDVMEIQIDWNKTC